HNCCPNSHIGGIPARPTDYAWGLDPILGVHRVARRATDGQTPLPLRLAQPSLDLAGALAAADRLTLVVEVLPARQGDLDLRARPALREVHARRDQRQPSLLCAPDHPVDLGTVKQQLAGALRIVVI